MSDENCAGSGEIVDVCERRRREKCLMVVVGEGKNSVAIALVSVKGCWLPIQRGILKFFLTGLHC
jgi:hypothetical protein